MGFNSAFKGLTAFSLFILHIFVMQDMSNVFVHIRNYFGRLSII